MYRDALGKHYNAAARSLRDAFEILIVMEPNVNGALYSANSATAAVQQAITVIKERDELPTKLSERIKRAEHLMFRTPLDASALTLQEVGLHMQEVEQDFRRVTRDARTAQKALREAMDELGAARDIVLEDTTSSESQKVKSYWFKLFDAHGREIRALAEREETLIEIRKTTTKVEGILWLVSKKVDAMHATLVGRCFKGQV